MEYSIDKLAKMAGVTSRTLRHYHHKGLLKPSGASPAGYRIYGEAEVDRLQQILFFRELGFKLEDIKAILDAPGFDRRMALNGHLKGLLQRRAELDALINTVRLSIKNIEGAIEMNDSEKFHGLKKRLVDENQQKYGQEARDKYGDEAFEAGNRRFMNLGEEEYGRMQSLGDEITRGLESAVCRGVSPESEEGLRIAGLHKQWLGFTWGHYSAEAHLGLAQMYIDDPRFTVYYDKNVAGCALFLKSAVEYMVNQ